MTPAERATARATIAGPANAVMVRSPEMATTAIVTRGCNGISGTGGVTGPEADAAARADARDTRVSGGGSGGASVT
jgi:hypothetical protein